LLEKVKESRLVFNIENKYVSIKNHLWTTQSSGIHQMGSHSWACIHQCGKTFHVFMCAKSRFKLRKIANGFSQLHTPHTIQRDFCDQLKSNNCITFGHVKNHGNIHMFKPLMPNFRALELGGCWCSRTF
jgi:hypothetical protein